MDVDGILEFFDAPASQSFRLAPAAAIAYFKSKGLKTTFDHRDMIGDEHAKAFTIAKMMDIDLLKDVQDSLAKAIEDGTTFAEWAENITPMLQAKGWWGKQTVVDPLTGKAKTATLGSPGRLQTIYRTNVQAAYAAGQWEQIQDQKEIAGYLLYSAIDDDRTRPEHAEWDGTLLPVDDDWWHSHMPPNGWNCRCSVIQLSAEEVESLGLKISKKAPHGKKSKWTNPRTGKQVMVEEGLDPGWNTNPAHRYFEMLQEVMREKLQTLSSDVAEAAAAGVKAANAQAQEAAAAMGTQVQAAMNATVDKAAAAAGKSKNAAASAQIAQALADNTPYLSAAIKQVQKTKAGKAMSPHAQLLAAQEKATKAQQSAHLAHYKKAMIDGKTPSQTAQAAFDALPAAAQESVTVDIAAKSQATKAAQQVTEELTKIEAGQSGPVAQHNLKQVLAENPNIEPAAALKLVQDMPTKLTPGQQAGGLAGWKKHAINGTEPTAKQQLAFDVMSAEKKAKVLAQVDQAKAAKNAPAAAPKPSAKAPTTPVEAIKENAAAAAAKAPDVPKPRTVGDTHVELHLDSMKQVGGQGGSNPGGLYRDTQTNVEWYLKHPASADAARNEVLAAKLYEAAGLHVPDVRYVTFEGRPTVASRIIDGLQQVNGDALAASNITDGFMVDAWLANWDVVGLGYDNALMLGGHAVRLDTGGALLYRAQGAQKGAAFGKVVDEIESLRTAGVNRQSAAVFGKMSPAELEQSAKKVLRISDAEIDRLVLQFGPEDAAANKALRETLKARKADIAKRYPKAAEELGATAARKPPSKRVTTQEQKAIEGSRVNGYSLKTDGTQIEDQNVIVSTYTTKAGATKTRVYFKALPDGEGAIQANMDVGRTINLSIYRDVVRKLVVGINYRIDTGAAYDSVITARFARFAQETDALLDRLRAAQGASAKAASTRLQALRAEVSAAHDAMVSGKAKKIRAINFDAELADITLPGKKGGIAWTRKELPKRELAEARSGYMRLTGESETNVYIKGQYETTINGARVRYTSYEDGGITLGGQVIIDVDGVSATATRKALDVMKKMGLNAERATAGDRLELYLDRIEVIRAQTSKNLHGKYVATRSIRDQAARNEAKLKLLNEDAGFDMRTSRYWDPDGQHQQFGHGRVQSFRPDLPDNALDDFAKKYVLYHNTSRLSIGGSAQIDNLKRIIEGGGQLASLSDRIRRGISYRYTSSVSLDLDRGGGNYVFTRIQARGDVIGKPKAGITWKADNLARRMDMVAYGEDAYGEVTAAFKRENWKTKVSDWVKNAKSTDNEAVFKDSLSIFEDVEHITLLTKTERDEMIKWMRSQGYRKWPDGRALEDVFNYERAK